MAILIIEDEFLVAAEIRYTLERAGFVDLEHVSTESEALKAIGTGHWAAAVVDANLNGRGIEGITADLVAKRIPFVIVTGYGRNGLPASIAGTAVLDKPFRPEALVNMVVTLCSQEGG